MLPPGGALPYVGGYRLPVISPLFYAELTQRPLFCYICKEFDIKILKPCAFCTYLDYFKEFHHNFSSNFADCDLKLCFYTPDNPHFWELTPKKTHYLSPHLMTPFFQRKKAPYFCTCTSLSCLSNPLPRMLHLILEYKIIQS